MNPQTPELVQIVISFSPSTSGVQVQGPLANKVLCYGMLESAKQVVNEYKPSPIIIPELVPKFPQGN